MKPNLLVQRYDAVSGYLLNQTDEAWDAMVRKIAALEEPRNEVADLALNEGWGMLRIAIAIWHDDEGVKVQAYQSREAAERDFPADDDALPEVQIVDSLVQP
jgi:hypothetical protein